MKAHGTEERLRVMGVGVGIADVCRTAVPASRGLGRAEQGVCSTWPGKCLAQDTVQGALAVSTIPTSSSPRGSALRGCPALGSSAVNTEMNFIA